MFWRLFVTYLLLVVIAVGFVGLVIYQRAEGVFFELVKDVALAVALVVLAAIGAAYLLAHRFARPLAELTDGARRLAEGDLGHKIRVCGRGEHSALAETFNAMSAPTGLNIRPARTRQRTTPRHPLRHGRRRHRDRRPAPGALRQRSSRALLGFDPAAVDRKPLGDVTLPLGFREIVEKGLAGGEPHREELEVKGPPRAVARGLRVAVPRPRHARRGHRHRRHDRRPPGRADAAGFRRQCVARTQDAAGGHQVERRDAGRWRRGGAGSPRHVPYAGRARSRPARRTHSGPAQPGHGSNPATSGSSRRRAHWARRSPIASSGTTPGPRRRR